MYFFSILQKKLNTILLASIAALSLSSCETPPTPLEESRDVEVRDTMRRVQVAAERYAANHGEDKYPTEINDSFKSYFPGGGDDDIHPAAFGPVNVFTGKNEFPSLGKIVDVHAARFGSRQHIEAGHILYCPLNNGKAYAILGGAHDHKALLDEKNPGQILIFSNLEDD